jgi:hypothetical protein
MKSPPPVELAFAFIDEKIKELGDRAREDTRESARKLYTRQPLRSSKSGSGVKPTLPGTSVFSHGGIVCTGEACKNVVKMTFARGAALKDPSGLFNSSLDGNVRRAIDIHEGDKVDEAASKDLIRAAVALNFKAKSKSKPEPKSGRASSKRAN